MENENLKESVIETVTKKEKSQLPFFLGVLCSVLASVLYLIAFVEGVSNIDWMILGYALVVSIIAFIFFSSWVRIQCLIGSVLVFFLSFLLFSSLSDTTDNYAVVMVWAVAFFLIGIALGLRFFNTTLTQSIGRILRTPTFKKMSKVVGILLLCGIGLLLISGLFSILAGLSATTIIIILLVLILLK